MKIDLSPELILFALGKLISDNNEEPLSNYKFKCTDKLMVMGVPRKAAGVENHGLKLLTDYEKKQLIPLNEMFIKNGKDVAELERNFLQGNSGFLILLSFTFKDIITAYNCQCLIMHFYDS